jgi:hypothetical protein
MSIVPDAALFPRPRTGADDTIAIYLVISLSKIPKTGRKMMTPSIHRMGRTVFSQRSSREYTALHCR